MTVHVEVGEGAWVRVEGVADGQRVRIAKVDLADGNVPGYHKPKHTVKLDI